MAAPGNADPRLGRPESYGTGAPGGGIPTGSVAMFHFTVPPLSMAIRSLAMYFALLVSLRVFGKREVGQFTLFDLVLVLLVANAIQPAMTGPDTSLGGGFVIIFVLFAANFVVALLRRKSAVFRELTEGRPTVIARDGHWIHKALRKEGIDRQECAMVLREHNLRGISGVSLAVLETDGTISILKKGQNLQRGHRKVARPLAIQP